MLNGYTVIHSAVVNAVLLPFPDNAHSVAMIRQSMNIVKVAVQHVHPGQSPALAADQPLYALAEEVH